MRAVPRTKAAPLARGGGFEVSPSAACRSSSSDTTVKILVCRSFPQPLPRWGSYTRLQKTHGQENRACRCAVVESSTPVRIWLAIFCTTERSCWRAEKMTSAALNMITDLPSPSPGLPPLNGAPGALNGCRPRGGVSATETETMSLRVRQLRQEADGVVSVLLVDPAGGALPAWTAGAHLELQLPSGRIRHYSLAGDPDDRSSYLVAVLREADGRGGSIEIHDSLRVGSYVDVRGPRNNFALTDAQDYILIAGGIGITPILSMARQLKTRRPWRLYYGGRSRQSMAFVRRGREALRRRNGRDQSIGRAGAARSRPHLPACHRGVRNLLLRPGTAAQRGPGEVQPPRPDRPAAPGTVLGIFCRPGHGRRGRSR